MTLFPEEVQKEVESDLKAYERHLKGEYDYLIPIAPMPTPRPRGRVMKSKYSSKSFVHFYNEPDYTKYKDAIVLLCRDARLNLRPGDYCKIFATMHIPYPASYSAKQKIDGAPHRKKPDWDNYIKGLQDALENANILTNDGAISEGTVSKKYTTKPEGFITFSLYKTKHNLQ